ncbi:TRAP transporter substrate-binding protein [Ruicaihuangia caeni]|uniref:TRAP transporter substrate-binding protein DctP n=1 Tax=Ruicaihuangia caeni TaxID=3042517 RepID=A0AAW6TAM3_9MICO|nr:TRAP transporter substrate-binding protein DctP [Klugiella sp. YN-L-19]MDI2099469.1 TRAP transporter substrate-binding protein DctP [Klugiella sp. YN-L-19]
MGTSEHSQPVTHFKRRAASAIAIASGAALALAACAPSGDSGDAATDESKPVTLSVASFLIDGTPNADMVHWWMDYVEEESGGSITFDYFANESLCPGAEIVQCVSDGRADLGVTVPSYTPDKFPLQNLSALPFMTDDNAAMMRAFYTLGQESEPFADESARIGLKALGYWPAGASLFGSKTPLESIEDLEGIRIRAVGDGLLSAMEAVGASPVALTAGEMYEGVERGVIDAVANNIDAPISYKLTEVLDHWTDTGYGHYITIGLWISQSVYDSLSAEQQAVIDDAEEKLNTGTGIEAFAKTAATQCDYMIEQENVSLVRWADADIAEFKKVTGTKAKDTWVKAAEAAGVAEAAEVLERYEELLAEYGSDEDSRVAPLADCAERFANER